MPESSTSGTCNIAPERGYRAPARVRRWIASFLLLATTGLPCAFAATPEPGHICVVLSEREGVYAEVYDALSHALGESSGPAPHLRVRYADQFHAADASSDPPPDICIAVGTAATETVLDSHPREPVLSILIPRATFEALRNTRDPAATEPVSAIYLDQPFERRLALARALLPNLKRVGVVLGPASAQRREELERAARAAGLRLNVSTLQPQENPVKALMRILDTSEAILPVPDPAVFSGYTVTALLLSTYRVGVPVIGFSHAYVNAGAVASVYSTAEQVARQAAEVLQHMAQVDSWKPPAPTYPSHYSVAFNERVARSLGITLPDEPALLKALPALEQEP